MRSFRFWFNWLRAASLAVVAFGLGLALLQGSALMTPLNEQIDPIFWSNPQSEATLEFQRWIYGAWGATIAGWGVLVYLVVHNSFRQREHWAWNALAASLLIWFILDTAISLSYGVIFNAVLNSAFLLFLGIPLFFTRSQFSGRKASDEGHLPRDVNGD